MLNSIAEEVDLSQATLTAKEMIKLLGVSRSVFYQQVKANQLPPGLAPIVFGHRLIWPTHRVMETLGLLPAPGPEAHQDGEHLLPASLAKAARILARAFEEVARTLEEDDRAPSRP